MFRRLVILVVIATLTVAGAAFGATKAGTKLKVYGRYTGKSTQGIAVSLAAATKSNARAFRYRAKMTCNDGTTYLDDYFTDVVGIKRNRFNTAYNSDAGAVSTRVTGTLSGARATGTIRIVERFSEVKNSAGDTPLSATGAIICDSGTVRWSARA